LNAAWLVDGDAAIMVRDNELTGERLRELVDGLLDDQAKLNAMRDNALKLAKPEAADTIATELIAAGEAK
jgi:UDP-N-acetylglucosamine--N-acetylmuramyl-(pentapeptide) pyrophosphoryl-undecaprenol N-acetylglucosamine transferase